MHTVGEKLYIFISEQIEEVESIEQLQELQKLLDWYKVQYDTSAITLQMRIDDKIKACQKDRFN